MRISLPLRPTPGVDSRVSVLASAATWAGVAVSAEVAALGQLDPPHDHAVTLNRCTPTFLAAAERSTRTM